MRSISPTRARTLAVVAATIGLLVLLWNVFEGAFACGTDTSYCALTREKNGYYDAVIPGLRAGDQVAVSFDSLRRSVSVRAGQGGRVCLVWASERTVPFLMSDGHTGRLDSFYPGPAPAGCATSSTEIPWNRADGLTSRWQYKLAIGLPALALLLLGLSAFVRLPAKFFMRVAGAGTVVTAIAVTAVIW